MAKKAGSSLSPSLSRVRRDFEAWRRKKRPGSRIPEGLWSRAVRAAREHGLARTSQVLRLDYYTLKSRMEKAPPPSQGAGLGKGAFHEVVAPIFSPSAECLLEVEGPGGLRRKAHVKGASLPLLCALVHTFLGGGGEGSCSR